MELLYLMLVLNTKDEEKVRTHIHSIPMWLISLISTCHILDTKDEEDVRTICCPWNATRSARMPPGALQRGNQPAENSLVYLHQGGRTWQAFGGGKHGHETFRQARNYNFRDKCVVFARNLKFSNSTQ